MSDRVLVVDDEQSVQRMFKRALSGAGYEVTTCSSGEEAIEMFARASPEVVLLDIHMRDGMDGLEALRRIRDMDDSVPVVMVTADGNLTTAVKAMKIGAHDYIAKPCDLDDLKMTVERALQHRSMSARLSYYHGEMKRQYGLGNIVGQSNAMQEVFEKIKTVAPSTATILVQGESGTGKELVARAIHLLSPRKEHPFVAFNCVATPEGLLESELFGHEKGAFTGAVERRDGRFVVAHKGTILLDEIGEMPLSLQAKLLRVLQEGVVERLGSANPLPVDVRVIATTNRDLAAEVADGSFRDDLYYRLNVVPMKLPPLRERREDIPLLVNHFLEQSYKQNKRDLGMCPPEVMIQLQQYDWPGNVRELRNIVERMVVLGSFDYSHVEGRPQASRGQDGEVAVPLGRSLADVEKLLILETLKMTGGSKQEAVKILGISIRTLRNKLNAYRQTEEEENNE